MIKFFRKIRQNLLLEGKTGKYLKYAIGEIVLVVVGILIALSINNWNEERKLSNLEMKYLKGIYRDLNKDVKNIDYIISLYVDGLNIMKSIEPTMELDSEFVIKNIDTAGFPLANLFKRSLSFQSTKGTYSSLIADGKSGIIKNEMLFEKIQSFYEQWLIRINNVYGTMKERQNKIVWQYAIEKAQWNYNNLYKGDNEKLNLDLANFWEYINTYCNHLLLMKHEIIEIINDIDSEQKKTDYNKCF
ncbi:DUF6090 family protein [Aestuariivivens sediminicola]|uniref:DUF6090 family protein n=1 Tax=Aestuariivivens sediminicola TaxID=2913560 RepID=UPI001F590C7A|nr:DUF6090 family protein [Aestuariivivens sediminicola]